MASLHVVILAAGAGTRMCSNLPKVLHPIMGRPILQHVIDAVQQLSPQHIWLIYGEFGEQIQSAIQPPSSVLLKWVQQRPQLGTGHALIQAYSHLIAAGATDEDQVLIVSADGPNLNINSLQKMRVQSNQYSLVLLNSLLENPTGFGRIIRNKKDAITGIIEEKEATPAQKNIAEIYSGIMLIKLATLGKFLPRLTNKNSKQEYYLTQLIELCHEENQAIGSVFTKNSFEARGINDRLQLAELERVMQLHKAQQLMSQGISIVDPARFDLRGELEAMQDVRIDINCIFEGEIFIDRGTSIGAHCILKICRVGKNVIIHPYTFIDGAIIADNATIGPFARIRPGTVLEESVHIGNFVEVKKSHIGKGSAAGHLSYLGDATIGENVNIGAGTITCNYNGATKNQTQIGDNAFIGSHTALVAPVTVEADATIGAGSIITKTAPTGQLTLSRSPQTTLKGWKRPVKK